MTNEPACDDDDPRRLLSSTRELTRRVRQTQRATWFPLLVLAAVTFAAIPAYLASHRPGNCVTVPPEVRACYGYSTAAIVYWPVALMLAYVVIAAFYIRRSQACGVGTRVWPYIVAGIVLALAVTGVTLWTLHHPVFREPSAQGLTPGLLLRLINPIGSIGLALLVLAWAERSWALLVLAVGYLVAVLLPVAYDWFIPHPGLAFPPQLLTNGSVLLLGGIGFVLAQRPGAQRPGRRGMA